MLKGFRSLQTLLEFTTKCKSERVIALKQQK